MGSFHVIKNSDPRLMLSVCYLRKKSFVSYTVSMFLCIVDVHKQDVETDGQHVHTRRHTDTDTDTHTPHTHAHIK